MKKILLIILSITLISLLAGCDNTEKIKPDQEKAIKTIEKDKAVHKSNSKEWYDFQEGLKIAEQEDKHIVIDFYADWCKWCKVMDEKTFSVPKVEKYLFENFVPIRINTESDDQVTFKGKTFSKRQLSGAFGVKGLPSLAFLTSNQEMITLIPGYIEKDQFLKILEYINKECYKKQIPFKEFSKNDDCK